MENNPKDGDVVTLRWRGFKGSWMVIVWGGKPNIKLDEVDIHSIMPAESPEAKTWLKLAENCNA